MKINPAINQLICLNAYTYDMRQPSSYHKVINSSANFGLELTIMLFDHTGQMMNIFKAKILDDPEPS